MWEPKTDILQKFTAAGWSGGAGSKKLQKTIPLNRVKAELGYSAADYFSLVYELITNRPEVNMEDLTGTELEEAETTLFKQAIAESIRSTMWVGPPEGVNLNAFDMTLRITILSLSLSAHTIIGSSGSWNVKLISFSSESTRNSFWKEAIISLKSINDTCRRILPF